MIRSLTAFTFAAFVATTAVADTLETVEVAIEYDAVAIETPEGATAALNSIAVQARSECRYSAYGVIGYGVDDTCVSDVVHQVVQKIGSVELAEVYSKSAYFTPELSERFDVASK